MAQLFLLEDPLEQLESLAQQLFYAALEFPPGHPELQIHGLALDRGQEPFTHVDHRAGG